MKKRFIEMLALFTGIILMGPALIVYPIVYILSGENTLSMVVNLLEGRWQIFSKNT
jgi:hypothetical protein